MLQLKYTLHELFSIKVMKFKTFTTVLRTRIFMMPLGVDSRMPESKLRITINLGRNQSTEGLCKYYNSELFFHLWRAGVKQPTIA